MPIIHKIFNTDYTNYWYNQYLHQRQFFEIIIIGIGQNYSVENNQSSPTGSKQRKFLQAFKVDDYSVGDMVITGLDTPDLEVAWTPISSGSG